MVNTYLILLFHLEGILTPPHFIGVHVYMC